MRKDSYLATLMMIPPKQKQEIRPFSQKTTREAFSVSLEGLKGVRFFVLKSSCLVHLPAAEPASMGHDCFVLEAQPDPRTTSDGRWRSAVNFRLRRGRAFCHCTCHLSGLAHYLAVEHQYAGCRVATSQGRPETEGTSF